MSRRAIVVLTLLAGLLLLAVLVATLPARVAWGVLAKNFPQAQLSGIEGTLWQGTASQLSINQRLLGSVQWQLAPLSLLRMTPLVQVELSGATLQVQGQLQRRADGGIDLRDLHVTADASWLAPALGIPLLVPTGRLDVNFAELSLRPGGLPQTAMGSLRWLDAGVTGLAQTQIGAVEVTAQGRDGQISGQIRNLEPGALQIAGNYALQDAKYQAEIQLHAEPANSALTEVLKYVGEASSDGGRLLKIQGEILVPK